MVYMGSKRRYCKYIVPIIQNYIETNNITTFIDCFCGGANLADKIECDTVIANDLSPSLIALHQIAQQNFNLIPTDGSREYWDKAYAEWKEMKKNLDNITETENMPLYMIGAIEWYSSFANGGFPRGYAKPTATRNYYQEAYRNHKKQAENPLYKKIKFIQGDYKNTVKYIEKDKTILYCDSPYKNTKPYAIDSKFDFEKYYQWLRDTSKEVPIFVSEQSLPADFDDCIVWQKDDATRTAGKDNNFKACEKLYYIDNRESKNEIIC